jgi:hypothetical protein
MCGGHDKWTTTSDFPKNDSYDDWKKEDVTNRTLLSNAPAFMNSGSYYTNRKVQQRDMAFSAAASNTGRESKRINFLSESNK